MVGDRERGTNWIHPNEKNNNLVYNPLSDKQYLSSLNLSPSYWAQKTVYDSAGNAYFPLPL